jgi:hypothetical protein
MFNQIYKIFSESYVLWSDFLMKKLRQKNYISQIIFKGLLAKKISKFLADLRRGLGF